MTDEANMVDEGNQQDQQVQQDQAEKMLSQTEVNGLIGRAKAEAAEKARRQADAEYQRKLEEAQMKKQQAEARGDDTKDIDVDALYQQVHEKFNEEMQRRQLEEHMQQVANNYQQKMSAGKGNYEDFDEVVKDFDPGSFPQIVYLVSGLDNAADIVYELSKNPKNLVAIDSLAQRSPKLAQVELQRLSQSISANKAVAAEEAQGNTNAPLDRLQPTNRTGTNGQMSVSDLKRQPWLKG